MYRATGFYIDAAGDPQIHVYKVRKEDSASSGIFLTPPGAGCILRDETFGTSNRDVFLPEAIGTLERRALQKIGSTRSRSGRGAGVFLRTPWQPRFHSSQVLRLTSNLPTLRLHCQ